MEKYVYQVCHAYRIGTLGTDSTRTFEFVFTFAEAEYPKNLWQSVRRLWRFCWCTPDYTDGCLALSGSVKRYAAADRSISTRAIEPGTTRMDCNA